MLALPLSLLSARKGHLKKGTASSWPDVRTRKLDWSSVSKSFPISQDSLVGFRRAGEALQERGDLLVEWTGLRVMIKQICSPRSWNVLVIPSYVRMLSEVDGIPP